MNLDSEYFNDHFPKFIHHMPPALSAHQVSADELKGQLEELIGPRYVLRYLPSFIIRWLGLREFPLITNHDIP